MSFEGDGRGKFVTFSGRVTGQEVIEHIHAIYEADADRRLRWKINDFLSVDLLDISNDEIRKIVRLREIRVQYYSIYLHANVLTEQLYRSASMIESVHADRVKGFSSETFNTIDAARRWIASILDAPQTDR